MRINHIAAYVNDLEKTSDFYAKYFGAAAGARYHNTKTGFESYFLTFADNCRYEIMLNPDLLKIDNSEESFGYAHIAFSVGDKEAVDSLTEWLRADGYTVISGPRTTGDGYYESCVLDPDGNRVEIVADNRS